MTRVGPKFTVVVPTYNQARYLSAALDSLLAQTDQDWEAVIVNDGSTDDTSRILELYAARDKRFRVIHQENGGVTSALNTGLDNASGDWICWLSSDDLFEPEKLAHHRTAIRAHPECRFFFSRYKHLDEYTGECVDHYVRPGDPRWQVLDMLNANYITGTSICIQRDAFKAVGQFDIGYPQAQDYDMWLRLMTRYVAIFMPEKTVITRLHPDQGTAMFPAGNVLDAAKASIALVHSRRFAELFPNGGLCSRDTAPRILIRALVVAGNPAASVYGLGPHPILLSRLCEWIGSVENRVLASRLRRIMIRWAKEVDRAYGGSEFGRILGEQVRRFVAQSDTGFVERISWYDIAEGTRRALAARRHPIAQDFARYLSWFGGTKPEHHLGAAPSAHPNAVVPIPIASRALYFYGGARWPRWHLDQTPWLLPSYPQLSWFPISAMWSALLCPSLARSRSWWMFVVKNTVLGEVTVSFMLRRSATTASRLKPRRLAVILNRLHGKAGS